MKKFKFLFLLIIMLCSCSSIDSYRLPVKEGMTRVQITSLLKSKDIKECFYYDMFEYKNKNILMKYDYNKDKLESYTCYKVINTKDFDTYSKIQENATLDDIMSIVGIPDVVEYYPGLKNSYNDIPPDYTFAYYLNNDVVYQYTLKEIDNQVLVTYSGFSKSI